MRRTLPISLILMAFCFLFSGNAQCRQRNGEEGFFMVSGHLYDLSREVGVKPEFLSRAIPFINRADPDFLVLTGDLVFAVPNEGPRSPETIRAQYRYLMPAVFDTIETKIYAVAGNHDTGKNPYPPAVELFEKNLNPLSFSFEHNGSLFLFLSLYRPFPHMETGSAFSRVTRVWADYDTAASRSLLNELKSKLQGKYNHVFIFTHFNPLTEFRIGYYWTNYLVPLLTSLKQDVHIFSTSQLAKPPFAFPENQVVAYKNLRFYCFAEFPVGSYLVNYDAGKVMVQLVRGSGFVPSPLKEVPYRPTTRFSMLKSHLYFWCVLVPKGKLKQYWVEYTGIIKTYFKRLFQGS